MRYMAYLGAHAPGPPRHRYLSHMSVRQGTPERKGHRGRCQGQRAQCAPASRGAEPGHPAVVPGAACGDRARTPAPARSRGRWRRPAGAGAAPGARTLPGRGGSPRPRRGRRPPLCSALRAGRLRRAGGRAPHPSAPSCGHGRRHERRLRRTQPDLSRETKGRGCRHGRAAPCPARRAGGAAAARRRLLLAARRAAAERLPPLGPAAQQRRLRGGAAPAAATPGAAATQPRLPGQEMPAAPEGGLGPAAQAT